MVPFLIWNVLFFITLYVISITTDFDLLAALFVLLMFLELLCIIPVIIWTMKKAQKIYRESFVKMDVMLTARDGMLYKDNMKLNVSYSERDNEVYLDNMREKWYGFYITFVAAIVEDDVKEFIAFCQENDVKVEVFN